MRTILAAALLSATAALPAAAQRTEQRPQNLKVLPADIPMRALRDTMATYTRALGVRCDYCHVQREGETLETMNFALDDKAEKQKAREMIRMTIAINAEHLGRLALRQDPPIAVSCATCHRGIAQPRPLQQLLLLAYQRAGADSAEKAYRSLRQRYFGRAAYDFGETALADVAAAVTRAGNRADALRFHRLNLEFWPNSASAHALAGAATLSAGDTATAIGLLEKALSINPNEPQARRVLDTLRRRRP